MQFKVVKVIPFHKGGRKSDIKNFRPIFSKILEKVVHKRLYNFLQMNRLLSQTQFGFRKVHSTTHALLTLVQSINCVLKSCKVPMSIFIDIRKAFDPVDYQVLLHRVRSLGINGVLVEEKYGLTSGRLQQNFFTPKCSEKSA